MSKEDLKPIHDQQKALSKHMAKLIRELKEADEKVKKQTTNNKKS